MPADGSPFGKATLPVRLPRHYVSKSRDGGLVHFIGLFRENKRRCPLFPAFSLGRAELVIYTTGAGALSLAPANYHRRRHRIRERRHIITAIRPVPALAVNRRRNFRADREVYTCSQIC